MDVIVTASRGLSLSSVFTAAIASLGPFLVGVALSAISAPVFFAGCAIFCALCAVLCWIMYARKNAPFPG